MILPRGAVQGDRLQHPALLPEASYQTSDWVVLVDGKTRTVRRPSNGDLADETFRHCAKQHPGRVLLIFSQADFRGTTIFETVVKRG